MAAPLPIKELKSRAAAAKKELTASGKAAIAAKKVMLDQPHDKDGAAGYRKAVAHEITSARNAVDVNSWLAKRLDEAA